MKFTQTVVDHFIREEGYRRKSYKDTKGFWTIGVGHFLGAERRWEGLIWDQETILKVLEQDIAMHESEVRQLFPQWERFDDGLKLALTDMVFNMGMPSFRTFKNTIRMIHNGQFAQAAANAASSKWATIDVPNRAKRVLELIKNGHYIA